MTRIRKLGALTLATSLTTGVLFFGTSAPAYADITGPSDGRVYTSGSSVAVSATTAFGGGTLSVTTPEGNNIPLGNSIWPNVKLSGSVPISTNGTYTVTLAGWGTSTRTFSVRKAPSAPSGLSATAAGNRVNVSWNQGIETDLTGYSVNVGGASKSGSVGSFCSGSTCSANVTTSATGSVNVSVTARRNGGTSASSATTVTISPGGGGSNQTPNLPSGGTGTSTIPLTSADPSSPYNLPNVAPEGSNPNFAYPTPPPQVAQQQLSPKTRALAADAPEMQWGKSIAIALILLLCAGHLGTWTRRLRLAQADGPRASRLGRARVSVAKARIAQAEALAKAGALSKEALLGDDPAEGKTKKGLLRRKTKGTDKAGMESPLEADPMAETAVLQVNADLADAPEESDDHQYAFEVNHSVEDALAALTRGSETRVEYGAAADDQEELYAEPAVFNESEATGRGQSSDLISSDDDRTRRRGRRGRRRK